MSPAFPFAAPGMSLLSTPDFGFTFGQRHHMPRSFFQAHSWYLVYQTSGMTTSFDSCESSDAVA
jgi:hypothetical protein